MAITGTYTHGTRANVQQDEKGTTSATWITWAEESTADTFYYWTGSGVDPDLDRGPTLDRYTPPEHTPPEPESEEVRLAREEKEQKEKEERKEAEHKAGVLLLELIGRVDYKKFCRAGYIDVEGNSGKIFRIYPGAMTKVFAGKDKLDVKLESLCIAMRDRDLPKADEMVWKKLMIESDEKAFVEAANHFD